MENLSTRLEFTSSEMGVIMQNDVKGFIAAVGQIDVNSPYTTPPEVIRLYKDLVDEEYKEFIEAPSDANKLQESMDLIWVVLGYCLARGWNVESAWKELTRANMSKLQVDPATGQLRRRADGKILKPEGWRGPDMTPFV
jgi:predicted HAD superfamily Cof-like phosphohydrolase